MAISSLVKARGVGVTSAPGDAALCVQSSLSAISKNYCNTQCNFKKVITAPKIVMAVMGGAFGHCYIYFGSQCSFCQLAVGFFPFSLVFVLVISLTPLVLEYLMYDLLHHVVNIVFFCLTYHEVLIQLIIPFVMLFEFW